MRDTLRNSLIKLDNPHHIQMLMIYNLGRVWGLHGSQEICDLMLTNVQVGVVSERESMEFAGLRKLSVRIPWDKTNQLSLTNNRSTNKAQMQWIPYVENEDDPLCPVRIWDILCKMRHPEATKVLGRVYKDNELPKLRKNGLTEVRIADSGHGKSNKNLGKGKVGDATTTLAKLCGFDNWWETRYTNHGNRRLLITKMVAEGVPEKERMHRVRHKNSKSQQPYMEETAKGKDAMQVAIGPNNGAGNKRRTKKQGPSASSTLSPDDGGGKMPAKPRRVSEDSNEQTPGGGMPEPKRTKRGDTHDKIDALQQKLDMLIEQGGQHPPQAAVVSSSRRTLV